MIKYFILFVSTLILFNCEEITKVYEISNGAIKGNVVLEPGFPRNLSSVGSIYIKIPGSTASTYADENGNFYLFNIPPGTYNITATSYYYGLIAEVENVKVIDGATTFINDILLESTYGTYYINDLAIIDSLGYNRYNYQDELALISRSAKLKGNVLSREEINNYRQGIDTTVSILLNNTRYTVESNLKGIFTFDFTLPQPVNEMSVWIGDIINAPHEEQIDSIKLFYFPKNKMVDIGLSWNSYEYINQTDAGDFDLHLISIQENDSCWYNNPNPDWGIKDVSLDNPELNDDTNEFGYGSGFENLNLESATPGTYTLKVYYFSNDGDSTVTITPEIRIDLDQNYNTYTSPTAMSVGDVWILADITNPSNKIKLKNQICKISNYSQNKTNKNRDIQRAKY